MAHEVIKIQDPSPLSFNKAVKILGDVTGKPVTVISTKTVFPKKKGKAQSAKAS